MSSIKGHCACGKINVEVPTPKGSAMCHCTDCRRGGGGPGAIVLGVPRDQVQLSGSEAKVFHTTADSGGDVQRYFCGDCGSPVMANADHAKSMSFVRGTLFEPGDIPKPGMHIYGKNMEEWEKPIEGAKVHDQEPKH